MNWFAGSKTYQSEQNGTITCRRFLGRYSVWVDSYNQTATYTNRLWKKSLNRLPKDFKVKNVLVLGYGGGGVVKLLHKKFKKVQITAVEWDPVMVQIADSILDYKKHGRPEIIIGDVSLVLPTLNRMFDLIIVDLFKGGVISQDFSKPEFLGQLSRLMKPKGALLLNAFDRKDLFPAYDKLLSCHKIIRFQYNLIGLYRHFGQGKIGDPLPSGFVPRFECWEYVVRNKPSKEFQKHFEVIRNTAIGVRWFNGLFTVEKYRTDVIPTITPLDKWRVALWYPYSNMQRPAGWRVDWTHIGTRQTGVAIINHDDYQENWNENLKRQLKKWQKQDKFEIVVGTAEEMAKGIKSRRNKILNRTIKSLYAPMILEQYDNHKELLKVWLIKDKVSGEVIAGLAVVDIPETKTSLHFSAFHYRDVDNLGGGTALIDLWYRESINKGYKFLDFDLIYTLGDPPAWRGYTKFKKQFGLHLIKYPSNWFKIIRPAKQISDK